MVTNPLMPAEMGAMLWVLVITASILSLILTFLFFYWMIRLGVSHGLRSHARWERSGEK